MFLIVFAALIAAGGTAKLDRTYLPPVSAATAGGSPGSLQLPFSRSQGSPGSQDIPTGGYVNDYQGIVVEAALAGTRASGSQSGLGGPRVSYGSSDSKVGDAAFRGTSNKFPQGPLIGPNEEPDLSAFHRPPSRKPGNIQVIRDYVSNTINYQNKIGLDKFNYAFETDNGIKIAENGISRNGIQAQGGYSYTGDDGKVYSVVYTADKNGYRPTGNHLPTPPPIPAEILESLKQNARDEAAGIIDDGSYDAKKYNTDDDYAENDANDKYNDRQSNKFGDRPVSVGGFINQNQQAFVAPNFNGQFGINVASKDSVYSKPDSSKLGSFGTQTDNRFGSIKKPSRGNANNFLSNKQVSNNFPGFSNSAAGFNVQAKPLSQQNLQEQKPLEPSFNRPSSYDTSLFSSSVSLLKPAMNSFGLNQGTSNNFGNGNNKPVQTFQNNPAPVSLGFNTFNQGSSNEQSLDKNKQSTTLSSSQLSSGYFTSQSTQQFPSSNLQSSQNSGLPSHQISPPRGAISSGISGFSNQPVFATPLKPLFPTKQPQTTLTTPLESFGATNASESFTQTDNNKKEELDITKTPATSQEFVTSLSQSTSSKPGDSSTSYTGADISTFNSLSNRFSGSNTPIRTFESTHISQPQGPDNSYIYNRPSKPFNTPFSGSISSSGQATRTTPSQSSIFTKEPETSQTFMQNEGVTGFNTFPQLSSNNRKENDFQSNKVTQDSFSTFPSIASGISSQPNARPSQQLSGNTPNVSSFSQVTPTLVTATAQASSFPNSETISTQGTEDLQSEVENASMHLQQNKDEVYEYPKPTDLPPQAQQENLQSGQGVRKPINQQSSFGVPPQPQFGHESFNNKGSVGSLFPTYNQQNLSPSTSSKLQNQVSGFKPQSQFEQQNFAQSRPQNQQIGFFGDKEQKLNINSATQFGSKPFTSVPSFSQSTSSGFGSPSILSENERYTTFKPTEGPVTQADFDNKNTTNTQEQESFQTSFPQFNKPSLSFSSQKPAQFGQQSFSSRRPGTEAFSVSSQVTSSLPQIGSQQQNFNNKETTSSQFDQSTLQFGTQFENKLSTQNPSSSQTQFSSYDMKTTNNQFSMPTTNFDQFVATNQLSHFSTVISPQYGQENEPKTTTSDEFNTNQPISTFNNFSSLTTSTSETQTPAQNSDFGQIYDYRKPSQGLVTMPQVPATTQFDTQNLLGGQKFTQPSFNFASSQVPTTNDGETESVTKINLQSTQEPFATSQISGQNSGEIYDYNKPDNRFGQQDGLSVQKEKPAQFPMSSFNLANSQFSTTNDGNTETVTQKNTLTGFPSTQEAFITSQNSYQNSGEGYEYNKPSIQFTQPASLSVQNEKPAHFTQPSFNFAISQFSTKEDKTESVTQQNALTGSSNTEETLSTSQNFDQNTGGIYDYYKPNKQFTQQGLLDMQKEKPAQFPQSSFSFATAQFSTNDDRTESVTQHNALTGFPSTQEAFSTSKSSSQNSGEIYEYNKPNNQFGLQGSISGQKGSMKPAQFTQSSFNFPSSQFSTTNEDKTESVTQQNTLGGLPSTQEAFSTSQNSGEIYEYNKPNNQFGQQGSINIHKEKPALFTQSAFNFPSSQFSTTNEDKTESVTQQNTLGGLPSTQEAFSTSQNSDQNSGEIYEYNKPSNQFGQQGSINIQKEKPAQFTQSAFNFPSSQFSTTSEDKTESVTQENTLAGFPSTQEVFSTSQNSGDINGEVYEYNKPEQSLSTSSEIDGTAQLGQKMQSTSSINNENIFTNQPTTQFGQTVFNFQSTQKTDDSTPLETTEKSRPQLAFHSACCGGSLFKKPLGSDNLKPSFNIFNQNKESTSGQSDQQSVPEKSSSFVGIAENFPSSKKPPSFDKNGYYY